jgi:hypothetical protein
MVSDMTLDPRPVATWRAVIERLPQPDDVSHYEVIAQRILGDLAGYRYESKWRRRDAAELAAALEALVQMELAAVAVEAGR